MRAGVAANPHCVDPVGPGPGWARRPFRRVRDRKDDWASSPRLRGERRTVPKTGPHSSRSETVRHGRGRVVRSRPKPRHRYKPAPWFRPKPCRLAVRPRFRVRRSPDATEAAPGFRSEVRMRRKAASVLPGPCRAEARTVSVAEPSGSPKRNLVSPRSCSEPKSGHVRLEIRPLPKQAGVSRSWSKPRLRSCPCGNPRPAEAAPVSPRSRPGPKSRPCPLGSPSLAEAISVLPRSLPKPEFRQSPLEFQASPLRSRQGQAGISDADRSGRSPIRPRFGVLAPPKRSWCLPDHPTGRSLRDHRFGAESRPKPVHPLQRLPASSRSRSRFAAFSGPQSDQRPLVHPADPVPAEAATISVRSPADRRSAPGISRTTCRPKPSSHPFGAIPEPKPRFPLPVLILAEAWTISDPVLRHRPRPVLHTRHTRRSAVLGRTIRRSPGRSGRASV